MGGFWPQSPLLPTLGILAFVGGGRVRKSCSSMAQDLSTSTEGQQVCMALPLRLLYDSYTDLWYWRKGTGTASWELWDPLDLLSATTWFCEPFAGLTGPGSLAGAKAKGRRRRRPPTHPKSGKFYLFSIYYSCRKYCKIIPWNVSLLQNNSLEHFLF